MSILSYGDYEDNQVVSFETAMLGFDATNSNWHSDFVVTSIFNKVFLEIHPYDGVPIDFDVDVTLDISYTYQSFPNGAETQKTHQLKVNYKKDAHNSFQKIDLLEISGGQLIQFTIDDFLIEQSLTPAQLDLIKEKILVKTLTEDTRYYNKNLFSPIEQNDIQTNYDEIKKEITITWPVAEYAEEYDIQWLFLDSLLGGESDEINDLIPNISELTPFTIDKFRNSSKLATKNNFLTIPVIEGRTFFTCRVRSIGSIGKAFHLRFEAPWSAPYFHPVPTSIHEEDKLNYQSITTFAENGKYKIVNQYFDGRMASRQKVTKLQSNNYALIQESIYDQIGRKAIEVLPAPVKSDNPNSEEGTIMYYDNFNRNTAGTKPYSAENFEKEGCINAPEPMSTISGASKYYSSVFYNELTPQEKKSELAHIPDAFQYPFTQTRFMNDNTNRPLAQGGVGKDHHIGSKRETEITYTTPTQSELDRLFGTEVGLAKYYKKVITEDPNNQVSVAYQDLKGNTIATSLHGTVDNLSDLASYQPVQMNDDLTVFNEKDKEDYEIYSNFVFYVPENNKQYNFDYSFMPAQFSMEDCEQICYDCIYDLSIEVVNTDCKKTILSLSKTIGYLDETLETVNATCSASNWNVESELSANDVFRDEEQTDPSILNLTLDKGNYVIKKILKVNESAADKYVENFVSDPANNCLKPFDEFLQESIDEIMDEPCEIGCDDIANSTEEVEEMVQETCDTINNKCQLARRAMISDFEPNGQYGKYEVDEDGNWSGQDELSIFSDNNVLGDNNTSINFREIITNAYPDANIGSADLRLILSVLWRPEWTELFLTYHPEYCYLQSCNECSAEYEGILQSINSASVAIAEGLLNPADPTDLTYLLENDPYFNNGINAYNDCDLAVPAGLGVKSQIKAEILNFFAFYPDSYNADPMSLYELAVYNVCSGKAFDSVSNTVNQAIYNTCAADISFTGSDTETADILWLQSKNMYLYLKEKYEYKMRSVQAINDGCYNKCIGVDDFNTSSNNFDQVQDFSGNPWSCGGCTPAEDSDQICNSAYSELYKDKLKRFPSVHDMPGLEDIDDIYDLEQVGENLEQMIDHSVAELTADYGCVIEGGTPTGELEEDNKCINYACLSELSKFFNQFRFGSNKFLINPPSSIPRPIQIPPCFKGSPFLDYFWKDRQYDVTGSIFTATIGSTDADENLCNVTLQFSTVPSSDIDIYLNTNYNFSDFVFYFTGFDEFEIIDSNIDQNGETTSFEVIAYSDFLRAQSLDNRIVPIKMVGTFSCAKFGRCCTDGVEDAIEACLRIPNVDNPTTMEEELWLGDSNPFFDPAWIQNPCSITAPLDLDFLTINCDENPACCTPVDSLSYDFDWEYDCTATLESYAEHNATVLYEQYVEETKKEIKHLYMLECLNAAEIYTMQHESGEHHFVLSYYDQAGNLTRIVPPNGTFDYDPQTDSGTDLTFSSQTDLDAVAAARANNTEYKPNYKVWDTRYTYNSLNQITTQNLPDHGSENPPTQAPVSAQNPSRDGVSKFYYDELGRLAYSQSPQQIVDNKFSYTQYDGIGRIEESGQISFIANNVQFVQNYIFDPSNDYVNDFISSPFLKAKEQITKTYYDKGAAQSIQNNFPKGRQENLRSRVAYAAYYDTQQELQQQKPSSASYYDYDELGNVKTLAQSMKYGFFKMMEYDYDLVSGNVNKVFYQRGEKDQFIHKYNYDADNRITEVHTSLDNCIWDKEAKYFYYPHGPLARVELGDEELQGMDYIYTIHGWIKGVNSIALDAAHDAGKDGLADATNSSFAPDEMGYMLNYYEGDYKSISGSQDFEPTYAGHAPSLYNGNIRNMSTSIGELIRQNQNGYGYISNDYAYDQLNRIKEMRPFDTFEPNSNTWGNVSEPGDSWASRPYYTNYRYDGNGNIFNLNRNGSPDKIDMDKLTYKYVRGNNQLTLVSDPVSRNNYPLDATAPNAVHDFDSQGSYYRYDRNGNLIENGGDDLLITWNVQGKVQSIIDENGFPNASSNQEKNIEFRYDPLGNRIAKIVDNQATLYVRDAQGNLLSTYKKEMRPEGTITSIDNRPQVTWESAYIYGSDRVGEYQANKIISGGRTRPDPVVDIPNTSGPLTPVGAPTTSTSGVGATAGIITRDIDFSAILDVIPSFTGTLTVFTPAATSPNLNQSAFDFKEMKSQFARGKKHYELTNHLGNVLSNISDRKSIATLGNTNTLIANVNTATDYYPGGMIQPERNYLQIDANTRFKHQGQESDDEIAGRGTNYFYKYRMSDARLNRFWSVEPYHKTYYQLSTYSFTGNSFLNRTEKDGRAWNYVAGGLLGAGLEYGFQVGMNFYDGQSMLDAMWTNVDFADVTVAGVEGAMTSGGSVYKSALAKITIGVTSTIIQNSVDVNGAVWSGSEKIKYFGDGSSEKSAWNVGKGIILDLGVGSVVENFGLGKHIGDATSDESLKAIHRGLAQNYKLGFLNNKHDFLKNVELDEAIKGEISNLGKRLEMSNFLIKSKLNSDISIGFSDKATNTFFKTGLEKIMEPIEKYDERLLGSGNNLILNNPTEEEN